MNARQELKNALNNYCADADLTFAEAGPDTREGAIKSVFNDQILAAWREGNEAGEGYDGEIVRGSLVRRTQDLDIFDCDECKRGEAGQ